MVHAGCTGKLIVIESMQLVYEKGVRVKRIRRCTECGKRIVSIEAVAGGAVEDGYIHGNPNRK